MSVLGVPPADMFDVKVVMETSVILEDADVTNIVAKAFETGGAGDFARLDTDPDAVKAAGALMADGEIVLSSIDEPENKWTLSMKDLAYGIKKYVEDGYDYKEVFMPTGNHVDRLTSLDAGYIVQLALFHGIYY